MIRLGALGKRALCVGLMVALLSGCTQLGATASADPAKGLEVYWIDVEGGAATLIVTPAGESVLVDTGNPGGRDSGRIVAAAKEAGLTKLDYVITTHYHRDHFGGAPEVIQQIPIGVLYDHLDENPSRDKPTPEYLAMKVGERKLISAGDVLPLKQAPGSPKLTLTCLAARKQFMENAPYARANIVSLARGKRMDLTDNANSVVLLLEFGDFRFFDGGDLTWNIENDLVNPINRIGTVDVYQVTHHGLDQSNNPVLVQAVEPTVAIMNNGATKGGMPEVFTTLKSTPSIKDIWQVHKNLRPDGSTNNTTPELIANHEAEADCKGHMVRMSVAGDAKSYTVSIPVTGTSKTYQTRKH